MLLTQIWDNMFINIDMRGKDLVAAGVMTTTDLDGWLHSSKSPNSKIVAVGLPAYCTLHTLLDSARANSTGLLLSTLFPIYLFSQYVVASIFVACGTIRCRSIKFRNAVLWRFDLPELH